MDFKNMSDSELARVMVNYISRVEHLAYLISKYIQGVNREYIHEESIREEYKSLKYELRKDANYLWLARNRDGSQLYKSAFSNSIREAAAWGFTVPVNHRIDQRMFGSVSDAHYKLTKYYTLEQWVELI